MTDKVGYIMKLWFISEHCQSYFGRRRRWLGGDLWKLPVPVGRINQATMLEWIEKYNKFEVFQITFFSWYLKLKKDGKQVQPKKKKI